MEVFVKHPERDLIHKATVDAKGKLSATTYCKKETTDFVETGLVPPFNTCKRCFKD